jgi:5-(carboxyamino)imidazole ribonucleotide synthase
MTPLLPGHTIGVLGGGQLGRMLTLEARRMGYHIVSWKDSTHAGPADVADEVITDSFESAEALERFLSESDVATVEFENIPRTLLEAIESRIRLAPSAKAVGICQHREREKEFLSQHGFPRPHYSVVDSAETLAKALVSLPGEEGILKTAEFGYDGKGQLKVRQDGNADAIWSAFDTPRAVLEELVDLASEISVLVARSHDGQTACYDPAENFHSNHILDVSIIPARHPEALLTEACEIALSIAEALGYEGIMAIEFFIDQRGRLLVNELAPRPHNSGHHTLDACQTSQFEQQLRTACGLPLGGTASNVPSVMWNLLGDIWPDGKEPDWAPILATPGAKLHLYGKNKARPGRKMGHVTFTAATADAALASAEQCRQAFGLTLLD